jgi:hypothetical protein
MGVNYRITTSTEEFTQSEGAKISYSSTQFLFPVLNILPVGLVFDNDIRQIEVENGHWQEKKTLFPTNKEGFYPFDIISAVFFMVSRYEEYLPFTPDQYGRFTEAQSISGKLGFTNQPIVHYWVNDLATHLSQHFEGWNIRQKRGAILFTYDIDVAYAFKGRPFSRHFLSLGKDVVRSNWENIKAKIASRFGSKSDPFDTYNLIFNNPVGKLFLFLLAQKKGQYDNNLPPKSASLQRLIRSVAAQFPIGIHPSFYSTDDKRLLLAEKNILTKISGKHIQKARQHFLRLRFPVTYRQLLAAGITSDYSLAYAEKPGFRAGICTPYPFFDIEENIETELFIHPTVIMDSTFRDDLKISAGDSLPVYREMLKTVLSIGGEFVCIWHNDLLAQRPHSNHPLNFRMVYQQLTEEIQQQNL